MWTTATSHSSHIDHDQSSAHVLARYIYIYTHNWCYSKTQSGTHMNECGRMEKKTDLFIYHLCFSLIMKCMLKCRQPATSQPARLSGKLNNVYSIFNFIIHVPFKYRQKLMKMWPPSSSQHTLFLDTLQRFLTTPINEHKRNYRIFILAAKRTVINVCVCMHVASSQLQTSNEFAVLTHSLRHSSHWTEIDESIIQWLRLENVFWTFVQV